MLSAAGKGDEDQANAQVAFLSAALSGAALVPTAQQSATIKAIAARHKGAARADARDLLRIRGIGAHNVFGIRLVQEVSRRFLKDRMLSRPFCRSSGEVTIVPAARLERISSSTRRLKPVMT